MNEAVKNQDRPGEAELESLCCGLLRGEQQRWPHAEAQGAIDRFVEVLLFHGTDTLVYEKLALLQACPHSLRAKLRDHAVGRTAWELQERKLIATALVALAGAGVDALVYKGTALAYSLYHNPVWRTRSDSDVLVQEAQLATAVSVLNSLGYRQCSADDEMIFYKLQFSCSSPDGGWHHIDLHWKLNNASALAGLFEFRELQARGHALNALAAQARTVGNVDALLIACLHRGVHQQSAYTVNATSRYTGDRLIWLYDIDQLVRAFSSLEWDEFFRLARTKGLAAICKDGLQRAQSLFATPLPAGWDEALHTRHQARPDSYLAAGALRRVWLDFLACQGLQEKLVYCSRVLFPSAAYMRNKYAGAGLRWLPWLYLRRALAGIGRRLGQGGQSL